MRTNPLPRLGEGIYTPIWTGHVGFLGVQHSLGPFLGPISILQASTLFYGTTDTLCVSYILAASTLELCDLFANMMCSKFKMSMMGKISFFLGLQISQSPRGIFINKSKYALESLKKYGFESYDPVGTPMVEKSKLDEDREGKAVDPSHYRDADHAGCQDTRRSTSGSVQFLGEKLISWSSKRKKSAA
nr:retrotransposon protein, putative, unclassified [Tanacetum cinerariifolium]